MKLLTQSQIAKLTRNGERSTREPDFDPHPVVKLFTPDAQCTWLLSEIDPEDPDRAFGLCDLGMGCPELGHVSLKALAAVRGQLGLPVERDRSFRPKGLLSAYAERAPLGAHRHVSSVQSRREEPAAPHRFKPPQLEHRRYPARLGAENCIECS